MCRSKALGGYSPLHGAAVDLLTSYIHGCQHGSTVFGPMLICCYCCLQEELDLMKQFGKKGYEVVLSKVPYWML